MIRGSNAFAKYSEFDEARREEAAMSYGDAARKLLRDSGNKGDRNPLRASNYADLDPLQQRDDSHELVAELAEMSAAAERYSSVETSLA